jgi:signal transduction histidine kinase
MNLRRQLLQILTLLLLGTVPMQAKAASGLGFDMDNPLIFGLDMDYAPLEYVTKDGIPHGLDVDFTQELMKRMNIPFTYQPNTWANISGDVIHGRVDLGMMVYSPYRKTIVNYSRAVFRLYYQAVFRKTDQEHFDMRNLAGKKIAYMSSRPITDTLTKAGAILTVVSDLNDAMKDLSKGTYDAVLCFRYQALYLIKKHGLDNLASEDLTLAPREYCYVSRNKQLIDSINVYLSKMQEDGTIEEIYGQDVTSSFGGIEIPSWVWYLCAAVVFLSLLIMLIMQLRHSKRLYAEMEHAKRSERMKTVFLGNISHALRTPLNGIIGFSEVLEANGKDMAVEERQSLYRLINLNGQQLLYFINELLELSNIESSKVELCMETFDVGEKLKEFCDELRPQLREGVELKVNYHPLVVTMDATFMRAVIMRLIENAVKYTKEGYIEVDYYIENNGYYFAVKDTGPGLPENMKDNIFNLLADVNTFMQSDSPGLGLSICKAVVDMAHGKIGVQSETGAGCTFWVWIPNFG